MPHISNQVLLWLVGLCVGSFLNVVVYRLPAGIPLSNPRWSFCPHCRRTLRWFENLPLVSWLVLRARCRTCHAPISVQYPLVEALTGLTFVLIYHLLFVVEAQADWTWRPGAADLPLLLAWLVLGAALVAVSAMDIATYTLDVRVTYVALAIGIAAHAVWPRAEVYAPVGSAPLGLAALLALGVSGALLWWAARHELGDMDVEGPAAPGQRSAPLSSVENAEPELSHPNDVDVSPLASAAPAPPDTTVGDTAPRLETAPSIATPPDSAPALHRPLELFGGTALMLLLTLGALALVAAPIFAGGSIFFLRPHPPTILAVFIAVYLAMVLTGGQSRAADEEIEAAIAEEEPAARRMVLGDLLWLLPAIVLGGGALVACAVLPGVEGWWRTAATWNPVGGFEPLAGIAYACCGAVVGAGAGWVLRVGFTLAFGREAFGTGDIYILAAAGAVVGWDLVLLGLLLSVGIALCGWVLMRVLKATVMIPYGPWLALGFLLALWLHKPARAIALTYWQSIQVTAVERPDLLLMLAGLLLVGMVGAIALAKLLRRWMDPTEAKGPRVDNGTP
ncbi:MAG: A24 family peptidase [Phycisphaerales bacterium]|nr:A24 family peptidase [Phycisphaerales bacterium]